MPWCCARSAAAPRRPARSTSAGRRPSACAGWPRRSAAASARRRCSPGPSSPTAGSSTPPRRCGCSAIRACRSRALSTGRRTGSRAACRASARTRSSTRAMARSDPPLEGIGTLAPEELGDAAALVREAGWNQVAADWRIFLDLGRVYAVRTGAGRVIATAATLPYGGRFAWISMVLVAGEYRRRGLASRLMRRCIEELTAAGLVPVLDATPAGRAVYGALGFEDAWGFHRLACGEVGGNTFGLP